MFPSKSQDSRLDSRYSRLSLASGVVKHLFNFAISHDYKLFIPQHYFFPYRLCPLPASTQHNPNEGAARGRGTFHRDRDVTPQEPLAMPEDWSLLCHLMRNITTKLYRYSPATAENPVPALQVLTIDLQVTCSVSDSVSSLQESRPKKDHVSAWTHS